MTPSPARRAPAPVRHLAALTATLAGFALAFGVPAIAATLLTGSPS